MSKKFKLGMLFGLVTGAVTGLFLAPKSGKQMRKDAAKMIKKTKQYFEETELEDAVREIFGKVSDETVSWFEYSIDMLADRLEDLKKNAGTVNREKYKELVSDTINSVKDEQNLPENFVERLRSFLNEDYQRLTGQMAAKKPTAKKTVKKKVSKTS